MSFKIGDSCLQLSNVVHELAQSLIAAPAKKLPHLPGAVVMVNAQVAGGAAADAA